MIKMIIEDRKLQRGFVDIKKANDIAVRNTLNTMAFLSRKNSLKKIDQNFIIRNKFTKRNIRVDKVNQINVRDMESRMGATEKASYMEMQEHGGIRKPKRPGHLAIPQLSARGGSKNKTVSRVHYLRRIKKQKLRWSGSSGTRKSRLVALAYKSQQTTRPFVYKKNIYIVKSFRKSGNKVFFEKEHLYNLSQKNAVVKGKKWMAPSIQKPIQDRQNIYNSQIRKLLRRKEII